MRLATKSTVILIAAYFLMLAALALWMEYQLRAVASALMEGTARLVGSEIAVAMSESARAQLLQGDPASRWRLAQLIADLSQRSDVVAAITVADENGLVVVSDDLEIGQQLALPDFIFHGNAGAQFITSDAPLGGGLYHLFVPLMREDHIVGYLRLSLNSVRMASLYRRVRHQVVVAAFAGLVCIGALGMVVHAQLSRRGAALARTVEATVRGEAVPENTRGDEFSKVIEAAGKLGREMSATRERSSQAQRRINVLANFMDVGVLLLGPDTTLEFANTVARRLLSGTANGDLEPRWRDLKPVLDEALATWRAGAMPPRPVDIDVPTTGGLKRLRFELHRAGEDAREEYLVLVKDCDLLEAFETDLRLATQMRGLARIYGALAHELKAPLGAMALNIELLNDALKLDDGTERDLAERRRRYATVLQSELARLNRSLIAVLDQTTSLGEAQKRFDLRDLIRDIEALLAPQAKHQRIALAVELPDAEFALTGHRDRLKQALLNIATNAFEAMPEGGRLEVTLAAQSGRATIAVRDTGPGITPEVLATMYTMYVTTKRGGTGIGLYVARSVVEAHGGEIRVDSQLSQGTCFSICLPLSAVDA